MVLLFQSEGDKIKWDANIELTVNKYLKMYLLVRLSVLLLKHICKKKVMELDFWYIYTLYKNTVFDTGS